MKHYRRAVVIIIAANVFLVAVKGAAALLTGSSAVFSDAANSFTDLLYGLLLGVGLTLAHRPADETHPQGHSRFEPFVSLIISIAMTSAGAFAIWNGIQRYLAGSPAFGLGLSTAALGVGLVVKVGMFWYLGQLGRATRSPAIRAASTDSLTDLAATTTALAGVWGARTVSPMLDPLAGVIVAFWIFRTAWGIAVENFGYLTGRGISDELTRELCEIAACQEGVLNVHQVIGEYVGPQLRIDMHINLSPDTHLDEAHEIAERVTCALNAHPDVDLVYVHIEPIGAE